LNEEKKSRKNSSSANRKKGSAKTPSKVIKVGAKKKLKNLQDKKSNNRLARLEKMY